METKWLFCLQFLSVILPSAWTVRALTWKKAEACWETAQVEVEYFIQSERISMVGSKEALCTISLKL